jgi:hypothetical protein
MDLTQQEFKDNYFGLKKPVGNPFSGAAPHKVRALKEKTDKDWKENCRDVKD